MEVETKADDRAASPDVVTPAASHKLALLRSEGAEAIESADGPHGRAGRVVSVEELARHCSLDDAWTAIDGQVRFSVDRLPRNDAVSRAH